MHERSTPEEYVALAETCLLEAHRTLDREAAEKLRIWQDVTFKRPSA
jgi:hypothetical protein